MSDKNKMQHIAEVVKALQSKGKIVAVLDVEDPENIKMLDLSEVIQEMTEQEN